MATIKKSGGWPSGIGGTNYKSKGGKVYICGNQGDKGVRGSGPQVSESKKGQVNVLGAGGDKGIPKKAKGGTSSSWAARHD